MGVAGWLQTKVTKQWDYYLTDLEGNKEEVVDSLENKATYVLEKSGRIIATLTLEAKPSEWDVEIWGKSHGRMSPTCIDWRFIGDGLLDWAEQKAKATGKKSIRFDCVASNEGLNQYYQSRYPLKEIIHIHGRHSKYEISR